MTTYKLKRCIHCGSQYYYQGSGSGCGSPLNNPQYCTDCQKAINEALDKVPVKFEFRYVDVKLLPQEYQYITKEKILEWNENFESGQNGRWWRRVSFPLFDVNDPENIEKCIIVTVPEGQCKGFDVEYRSWSKKPEWDNVRVKVDWDIINDKLAT